MDVFKRFRSRRKGSKGQAESFGSLTDAEFEHRSSISTWRDGTDPTPGRARPRHVPILIESTYPSRTASPANSRRPGSSGRVQPVFVGISRPDGTTSRPGTAGSTQYAFNRTTDLTATTPTRNIASSAAQKGTKSLRYVDIFAITGQPRTPSSTYNEDVAQRNLANTTLSEQEKQLRYKPLSKHHEDHASYNAHQSAVQRSFSVRSDVPGNLASEPSNNGLGLIGSWKDSRLGSPRDTPQLVPEPLAFNSRNYSPCMTDTTQRVPSNMQEGPGEEALRAMKIRIEEAEREMEAARQKWLDAKRMNTCDYQSSGDEKPSSERVVSPEVGAARGSHTTPTQAYKQDATSIKTSRDDSIRRDSRGDQQIDYQLSSSELNDKLNPLVKINSQQRFSDSSRRYQPSRASSNLSTGSGKRKLVVGNRMIMDLTEDDTDLQSILSYRETPVLQQATSGAFQKVRPEVVETHSPVYGTDEEANEAVPNKRWSSALEPVLNMDQLARRSQIQPVLSALEERPPVPSPHFLYPLQPSTPPINTFGFSAVSTITSTSPRASQAVPIVAHTEGSPRQVEAADSTPTSVTKDSYTPPIFKTVGLETSARRPAAMASRVSIIADVAPEESESTDSLTSDKTVTARTIFAKAQERLQQDNLSLRREVAERGMARQPAVQAARQASQDGSKAAPKIASIPEQEVKTRDFALMPLRKTSTDKARASKPSKRSEKKQQQQTEAQKTIADIINPPTAQGDAKPKSTKSSSNSDRSATRSGSKGKRPVKQNSSATRKTRPMSIFDEEAFKRKQANANAALLKLQMSLNETLPAIEPELQSTLLTRSRTVPIMPILESPTTNKENVPTGTLPVRSASTKNRPQPIAVEISPTPDGGPAAAATATATTATVSDRRSAKGSSPSPFMSHSRTNTPKNNIMPLNPYLADPDTKNQQQQQNQHPQPQRPPTAPAPPRSPGEISLSSFPIPTPRAMSPEVTKPTYTTTNSARNSVSPSTELARRDSQRSRLSTASTYSIPFSMVPGRNSSLQSQQQHQNQSQSQKQRQSTDARSAGGSISISISGSQEQDRT